jgi:esterase/lipase superfamily enzyme
MILRPLLLVAATLAMMFGFQSGASAAEPELCFPVVGCLDSTYVRVADLQKQDCQALAAMRAALSAKRPGKPRSLKERANLRLISRVERQNNCIKAVAAKKSKPPVAAKEAEAPAPSAESPAPMPETVVASPAPEPAPSVAAPKPAPKPAISQSGSRNAAQQESNVTVAEPAPTETRALKPPAAAPADQGTVDKSVGGEQPAAADLPYVIKTVYYATDRKLSGRSEPNLKYSGDRGPLVYGFAEVSIPKDHRIGELEAPSIYRLEFSEDPKAHVVLLSANEKPANAFYAEIAARVADDPGKNAFIFVHGFNVTFKDAARRTAQIAYDLKFDGVPAFFSWPSQGNALGYKYDEGNVEWAASDLKQFLAEFADQSGAENLYLVGHSMGTRALVSAVKDLFQERPEMKKRFKEIILAAPDIDADTFRRSIAPAFKDTNLVTLYASSKDLALTLSKQFNGYARAGDSGSSLVVMPGIDTIEASDVETDFVGHAYFGASTSIITDIYEIFRGNTVPTRRPHLRAITDNFGAYWKFQRGAATP